MAAQRTGLGEGTDQVGPGPAWVVRLRWGVAGSELLAALLADRLLGVSLPLASLVTLIALALLSNLWLWRRVRRGAAGEGTLVASLLFDTVSLAGMLAVSGGPSNPFSTLFLVYVTLSAVLLRPRWTWFLTLGSILCFAALFVWHVPVPALSGHAASLAMGGGRGALGEGAFSVHLYGMIGAFAVAAVLIAGFVSRTAAALRERDQALSEAHGRAERLASLTALAGGAAHELGSPLATIAVVAKELERSVVGGAPSPSLLEDARLVRAEVERCRAILGRLSREAGAFAGESMVRVSAQRLLAEALEQLGAAASRVRLEGEADPTLEVPRHAFVSALVNLLRNALDASPADATVALTVRDQGQQVLFEVRDRGRGMAPGDLRRATEPFFTTKGAGRGLGLGLFLVDTLMQRLGGRLSIESRPGAGTRCALQLGRAE